MDFTDTLLSRARHIATSKMPLNGKLTRLTALQRAMEILAVAHVVTEDERFQIMNGIQRWFLELQNM